MTESGWTVSLPEVKQILRFLGIGYYDVYDDNQFECFLKEFLGAMKLDVTPVDLVAGDNSELI